MEERKPQQSRKAHCKQTDYKWGRRKKVSDKETDLREKQMETWITTIVSLFLNRVQFRDEVQTLTWEACQGGLLAKVPKKSCKVIWWDKSLRYHQKQHENKTFFSLLVQYNFWQPQSLFRKFTSWDYQSLYKAGLLNLSLSCCECERAVTWQLLATVNS